MLCSQFPSSSQFCLSCYVPKFHYLWAALRFICTTDIRRKTRVLLFHREMPASPAHTSCWTLYTHQPYEAGWETSGKSLMSATEGLTSVMLSDDTYFLGWLGCLFQCAVAITAKHKSDSRNRNWSVPSSALLQMAILNKPASFQERGKPIEKRLS